MRGIVVFLIAAYIAFAVGAVVSEINNYNTVADFYSKEKINVLEFVKSRFIDILINPIKVAEEVKQKAKKIEKESKRNDITKYLLISRNVSSKLSNQIEKSSSSKSKKRSEKSSLNPKPPRELLASYLALLDEVEKKLKRFDLKGELYLSNSSKYMNLSEDELLQKIKEKEEKINELAKQTLRKKIDYKGVEINRFEGEKYFVFIKNRAGNLTVAQRILVYSNPKEILEIFNRTLEKYVEIIGVKKIDKRITVYVWDYANDYREALNFKEWWKAGTGREKYGKVEVHISLFHELPNTKIVKRDVVQILSHEATHALDFVYGFYPITPLLGEGFADYMEYTISGHSPQSGDFPYQLRIWNCTTGEKFYSTYISNVSIPFCYNYGFYFVKFLIEEKGVDKFREIYRIKSYIKDYDPEKKYFNIIFKKIYGKDLEELDRELRMWLHQNNVPPVNVSKYRKAFL